MQNEKKLVVLFPGFGYGPDKPLLYYAAKVARRQGLDCMVVQYSQLFPHEETPQASAAASSIVPKTAHSRLRPRFFNITVPPLLLLWFHCTIFLSLHPLTGHSTP